ncbi:MAG: hypothetical protein GY852_00585 [bacterium]|nr:hypothetical protein [bacterium]
MATFMVFDGSHRLDMDMKGTGAALELRQKCPDSRADPMSHSTTLLVKKDLNFDVHLFPFHWENPDNVKNVGLFDAPEEEKPVAFGEEL